MPIDVQPMDGAYFPPAYLGHNYTGQGEIVTIRIFDEIVGHMTRQGWDKVGFLSQPDLTADGHTIRIIVEDILRRFAREGRPMVDAWAEILKKTMHDRPVMGPLDGFRGDQQAAG